MSELIERRGDELVRLHPANGSDEKEIRVVSVRATVRRGWRLTNQTVVTFSVPPKFRSLIASLRLTRNQSRAARPNKVSAAPSSSTVVLFRTYVPFRPPPLVRLAMRAAYFRSVRVHSARIAASAW